MNRFALSCLVFLSLLTYIYAASTGGSHSWNYDIHGPDYWQKEFHDCKGVRQSPINIESNKAQFNDELTDFIFENYDTIQTWNVSHNGHTIVIRKESASKSDERISVHGSNLKSKFELLQFHFHWGYNDYQGSEHYIDGEKYPLEMHLVHRSNKGEYTVLGFLFKLVEEDNEALDSLIDGVAAVKKDNDSIRVSFSLNSILPTNLYDYYRYIGSLTTPPCTEGILWNVFTNFIEISSHQLEYFHYNILKLNFREPQMIYNRKVFSSFQPVSVISRGIEQKNSKSSANSHISNNYVLFILINPLISIFILFNF